LSYSDKYKALIKPIPTIVEGKIQWSWEVTLTDKYDDKTYPFSGPGPFASAEEAMRDGGTTMVLWMQALDKVKEIEVQEVNLDAKLPEPEPEVIPEPEVTPDAPEGEPEKTEPEVSSEAAPEKSEGAAE
jgi:hypothetical protein